MTRTLASVGELADTLRADFRVNTGRYERLTVVAFRLSQARHRGRLPAALRPVARVLDHGWLRCVVGAELPGAVECGPGLRLPHAGRGVILSPHVVLGAGVTIYHGVTLGIRNGDLEGAPVVGDGAYLGVGATALGRVVIGERARVGAGAVVVRDVPAGATAVGVPARAVVRAG